MLKWVQESYTNLFTVITVTLTLGSMIGAFIRWIFDLKSTHISDLKKDNSNLKVENERLRNRVAELESEIKSCNKIEQIESSFSKSTNGEYLIYKDMNICPKCWYDEHKTIPIHDLENGYYACPKCNCKGIYDKSILEKINQDDIKFFEKLNNIQQNDWFEDYY